MHSSPPLVQGRRSISSRAVDRDVGKALAWLNWSNENMPPALTDISALSSVVLLVGSLARLPRDNRDRSAQRVHPLSPCQVRLRVLITGRAHTFVYYDNTCGHNRAAAQGRHVARCKAKTCSEPRDQQIDESITRR
eukprot:652143-Hanusia_phi.AAC.1